MQPSAALRLVREKMNNPNATLNELQGMPLAKRTRASGYKKKRGSVKQAEFEQIAAYALANPTSTVTEISLEKKVSASTVAAVLKEFKICKAEKRSGNRRVPWVRLEDLLNKSVPEVLGVFGS